MRTLIRFVIVMSVFVSNRQAVVIMFVPVIPLFTVMLVTTMLVFGIEMLDTVTLMLVVPVDATFDDMPMLTGMSVMRATSENRMQQHRRHRQNAGQGLKHEDLNVSTKAARASLRYVFVSTQSELSLECETGQSGAFRLFTRSTEKEGAVYTAKLLEPPPVRESYASRL